MVFGSGTELLVERFNLRASGIVMTCTTPAPVSFFNAQSIFAQYVYTQMHSTHAVSFAWQTLYHPRTSMNSRPTASTISTLTTRSKTPSHSFGMLL